MRSYSINKADISQDHGGSVWLDVAFLGGLFAAVVGVAALFVG